MIRDVEHRGHAWQIVDENPHTKWVLDELSRWEADTFDTIDGFVHGGVFVDVGAWIGLFSLYAAPVASRVYALEPDPVAREMLRRNLQLNAVDNVTVLPFALWDEFRRITLYTLEGLGSSMTGPTRQGDPLQCDAISPAALRHLIGDQTIDLVKVDTEGSEAKILPGLIDWPVPIHLSIHGNEMDPSRLDFHGRKHQRLSGDPVYYSVLIK